MKNSILLAGAFALALASTTSFASASTDSMINVRAWIDGRSRLILDDDTATWQHFDFAAPGRLECNLGTPIEPTYLDGFAWFPDWADVPDCENRFCGGCFSSTFVGLQTPIPNSDSSPVLVLNQARANCSIVEYPTFANGYRIVIEFDDFYAAADWYDIDIVLSSCGASGFCASLPNSSGNAATIGATGSFGIGANDTQLFAVGCPPTRPGIFFCGPNPAQIPFANGYLCVSPFQPGLTRVPHAVVTDATGHASTKLDLPSLPPSAPVAAGSTLYFQFWFRDPLGGGAASNLSDGLSLTFCP